MKPVKEKSQEDIIKEWENIAKLRAQQIESGKDLSFVFVLVPCILELTVGCDFNNVIDVGCGPGALTNQLAKKARFLVAVDISKENIRVAQERCKHATNVKFINSAIEDYADKIDEPFFTLAIANMSLMTTLNLEKVVMGIARVLKSGAHFVLTITHPCFWPFYWEYAFKDWFDYKKEIPIEGLFKVSLETFGSLATTHVHRPLQLYISVLVEAGFIIKQINEPMPTKEIESKYPRKWQYPRFLAMRCIRR